MGWTKDEFCEAWFHGNLGRKVKYGHYYVIKCNEVSFLLHYNPDRLRNRYYRSRWHNPKLMGCRDNKGTVILDSDLGWKEGKTLRRFKNMAWEGALCALDKDNKDLTHMRVLDHIKIKQEPQGATSGIRWKAEQLALYDVDGVRLLTDPRPSSGCVLSFEEYADNPDYTNLRYGELLRVDGYPKTIQEARLTFVPEKLRGPETLMVNGLFLVPEPNMKDPYKAYFWDDARSMPSARGWGIPSDLLSRGTDNVEMVYRAKGKNWKIDEEEEKIQLDEIRGAGYGEAVVKLVRNFALNRLKWEKANAQIIVGTNRRWLNNHDLRADSRGHWRSQDGFFVRGRLTFRHSSDKMASSHDLGDRWYRCFGVRE